MAKEEDTIPPGTDDSDWLPSHRTVVLVADQVESVRLMEQDEAGAIARWIAFLRHVSEVILPTTKGRLVKSLGDGLMAEFSDARDAAAAAFAIHTWMRSTSTGEGTAMTVRVGIHASRVYLTEADIYGRGVNLAARIATLAGPGETVVTASVADGLSDGLDGDLEDLGECYLKHVEQPVRAYRLGPAGPRPVVPKATGDETPLNPTVTVIPFESRSLNPQELAIGDLIADGVIASLSLTADLKVISRLSSAGLRGRRISTEEIGERVQADYVLTGSYLAAGERLLITAELAQTRSGEVIWTHRLTAMVGDLLVVHSEPIHEIAAAAHDAVLGAEVRQAQTKPLPTLSTYSLMLGGISLMHRQSKDNFFRARDLLEHLCDRHPRIGTPRAWLAKWHSLTLAQGWSGDPRKVARIAHDEVRRALDHEEGLPLAWTVKGLIHGYVERDFELAEQAYAKAIEFNQSESLAWLCRATLSAWTGQGDRATDCAERALSLSPMHPHRYYYDSLAATAFLSGGNYAKAIELCRRSLRANVVHVPTYKSLVIALALDDQIEEARMAAATLMRMDPEFSVSAFVGRSPIGASPFRDLYARALAEAGVPFD